MLNMGPWNKRLLVALLKLIRFIADFISDIVYKLIYEGNRAIKISRIQDDLLLRPAIKLAELIRTRQVTSVQVISAFIQRINNVNGIINAVVDERFELALLDAKVCSDGFVYPETRGKPPTFLVPESDSNPRNGTRIRLLLPEPINSYVFG